MNTDVSLDKLIGSREVHSSDYIKTLTGPESADFLRDLFCEINTFVPKARITRHNSLCFKLIAYGIQVDVKQYGVLGSCMKIQSGDESFYLLVNKAITIFGFNMVHSAYSYSEKNLTVEIYASSKEALSNILAQITVLA